MDEWLSIPNAPDWDNELEKESKQKSVYEQFAADLRRQGFVFEKSSDVKKFLPAQRSKIIPYAVRYFNSAERNSEKGYFARLIGCGGSKECTTVLINALKMRPEATVLNWTIADSLYGIADASIEAECLKIIADNRYGKSRQMLILMFGRVRSETAKKALIALLSDWECSGYALEALSKYNEEALVPHFERFQNSAIPWVRKTAQTYVRRYKPVEVKVEVKATPVEEKPVRKTRVRMRDQK